jgi:enoyl-CoA hydratase/carnithine racemase
MALGVADRILMMENAIYSVISPENAASLVYRDHHKAEELATALKLTAVDCKELGVVDVIVPEPEGGAHEDPDEASRLLRNAIQRELLAAQQVPIKKLLKDRYKKYRSIGEYTSYFRSAISKEITEIQDLLHRGVIKIRERFSSMVKEDDQSETIDESCDYQRD